MGKCGVKNNNYALLRDFGAFFRCTVCMPLSFRISPDCNETEEKYLEGYLGPTGAFTMKF